MARDGTNVTARKPETRTPPAHVICRDERPGGSGGIPPGVGRSGPRWKVPVNVERSKGKQR